MSEPWLKKVPVLESFAQVSDASHYAALPDDWHIGVSDVVDSTGAIEAGRYKAVNLAGAATISAVANALSGDLRLFVFGGDGARFAVSPKQAPAAVSALSRVAMWADRDLGLNLRVGTMTVADVRTAGFDVRVAFWPASDQVRYAMFSGGGMEWAEKQLKSGAIGLAPAAVDQDPNLAGLSCQWGPVPASQGTIVSLIVKPAPGASQVLFAETLSKVIAMLEAIPRLNPVPAEGPDVHWPSGSIALQSRIARKGRPMRLRHLHVLVTTALTWLVFKLGIRIGRFNPERYRREIALNTDFRKFDDALMMTVDCSPDTTERLRTFLDQAVADGIVRYGLHTQDEALITCVVPSVTSSDHIHFLDGAGGGYASAAKQLRA